MDPVFDTAAPSSFSASRVQPAPPAPPIGVPDQHTKPLWAAVSILGLAVAALGSTLVYQNARQAAANAGPGALNVPAALTSPATFQAPAALPASVSSVPTTTPQPPAALLDTRAPATQSQAPSSYAPESSPAASPPERAPAAVVTAPQPHAQQYTQTYSTVATGGSPPARAATACAACGRVESVVPVQRAVPTTGVGAVAGGVLGAVLGNQIGHGGGRAVATIAGAAGGGYLGNTVEKHTRSQTVYSVRVRMDDGRLRTFERTAPVAVGEPVTVEGHNFRLGRAAAYSTQPRQHVQQVAQPQGSYATGQY